MATAQSTATMHDEIAVIDEELESARRDLHETMAQFSTKVGRTEAWLSPNEVVKRNPWASSGIAAAAGFVAGGGVDISALESIALGALLGLTLWIRPASNALDGEYREHSA